MLLDYESEMTLHNVFMWKLKTWFRQSRIWHITWLWNCGGKFLFVLYWISAIFSCEWCRVFRPITPVKPRFKKISEATQCLFKLRWDYASNLQYRMHVMWQKHKETSYLDKILNRIVCIIIKTQCCKTDYLIQNFICMYRTWNNIIGSHLHATTFIYTHAPACHLDSE